MGTPAEKLKQIANILASAGFCEKSLRKNMQAVKGAMSSPQQQELNKDFLLSAMDLLDTDWFSLKSEYDKVFRLMLEVEHADLPMSKEKFFEIRSEYTVQKSQLEQFRRKCEREQDVEREKRAEERDEKRRQEEIEREEARLEKEREYEREMKELEHKQQIELIKAKAEIESSHGENRSRVSSSSPGRRKARVKLPAIKLPKFGGNPLKWQDFYEKFIKLVHEEDAYSDIEKFQYLLSSLEGEGLAPISGISQTGDNYDLALQVLCQRHGKPEIIRQKHFVELSNIPPAKPNDYKSLQSTFDTANAHIRSLLNLYSEKPTCKLNHTHCTPCTEVADHDQHCYFEEKNEIFASLLLAKLPAGLRSELTRRKKEERWTLGELESLLLAEIDALQMGEEAMRSSGDRSRRSFGSAINALPAGFKGKKSAKFCTFCDSQDDHMSWDCSAFPDLQSRMDRLKELRKCTVCCTRHKKSEPHAAMKPCFHCQEKSHRSSLCFSYFKKKKDEKGGSDDEEKEVSASCASFRSVPASKVASSSPATPAPVQLSCSPASTQSPPSSGSSPPAMSSSPNTGVSDSSSPVGSEVCLGSNKEKDESISAMITADPSVYMQTALTKVKNPKTGKEETFRVFFDSCSSRCLVSQKVASAIQSSIEKREVSKVSGVNDKEPQRMKLGVTSVALKFKDGSYSDNITVRVLPQISCPMTRVALPNIEQYRRLMYCHEKDLLADTLPVENEEVTIDVLIGMNVYGQFMDSVRSSLSPSLYMNWSRFGWILCGSVPADTSDECSATCVATMCLVAQDHPLLSAEEDFSRVEYITKMMDTNWELETLGITEKPEISDDDLALKQFNDSVTFKENRYYVKWPWKGGAPPEALPVGYGLAFGRLKALHKRLKSSQETDLLDKYHAVIMDQLQKGVIEPVPIDASVKHKISFLPHHGVYTPNRSTKVCVVMASNAKARNDHLSLKDAMYRGPVYLEDLCGLLMRGRLSRFLILSDIEKAFLQICLQDEDRDVTRFLWLKDPLKEPTEDNLVQYRFARVLFGMNASPFLLAATIAHHLHQKGTRVADEILNNIYVDNISFGCDSVEDCLSFYRESKSLFSELSMNLREYTSNSCEFMKSIPEKDRGDVEKAKMLGIRWDLGSDTFSCPAPKSDLCSPPTKRLIVQAYSQVFDVLGFASPVVISAKILSQKLWRQSFDWDDPLPAEHVKAWSEIAANLKRVPDIKVARYIPNAKGGNNQLHCFTDASNQAFAAAVYLVTESESGQITSSLIMAKSRVAPKREMTIPRLELMGMVIGSELLNFVKKHLQLPISKAYLWSDSQIALHWNLNPKLS